MSDDDWTPNHPEPASTAAVTTSQRPRSTSSASSRSGGTTARRRRSSSGAGDGSGGGERGSRSGCGRSRRLLNLFGKASLVCLPGRRVATERQVLAAWSRDVSVPITALSHCFDPPVQLPCKYMQVQVVTHPRGWRPDGLEEVAAALQPPAQQTKELAGPGAEEGASPRSCDTHLQDQDHHHHHQQQQQQQEGSPDTAEYPTEAAAAPARAVDDVQVAAGSGALPPDAGAAVAPTAAPAGVPDCTGTLLPQQVAEVAPAVPAAPAAADSLAPDTLSGAPALPSVAVHPAPAPAAAAGEVVSASLAAAAGSPPAPRSPSPPAPAADASGSGSGEVLLQQEEGVDGDEGDCVMRTVVVIRTKPAVPGAWVCGLGSGLVAYVGWTLRCWEGVRTCLGAAPCCCGRRW
jgi:hypothetical protein